MILNLIQRIYVCHVVTYNEPTNILNNTDKCVEHSVHYYINISTTKDSDIDQFVKSLKSDTIITIKNSTEQIDYPLQLNDQVLISAGKKFKRSLQNKINGTNSNISNKLY